MVDRFIVRCIDILLEGYHNKRTSILFLKGVAGYTLVKILLIWKVSLIVNQTEHVELSGSLSKVLLNILSGYNLHIFFIVSLLILGCVILKRPNYVTNILVCFICITLYIVNFAIRDGSDVILMMLSVYALTLSDKPTFKNENVKVVQILLFNSSRILIQSYVVFIYLSSGIDKLLNDSWRSGDAINRIRHFEGLYNPTFPSFFQTVGWDTFFAWGTIATELIIALMIWIKPVRPTVLLLAVIFHLAIWWMVTLPDFALIMIVSLLIFVDDDQLKRLENRIKPMESIRR